MGAPNRTRAWRLSLKIQANVQSQARIKDVRLYYCILKAPRFNDAKDRYTSVPMKRVGDTPLWEATLPAADIGGREAYWYVSALDQSHGLESEATTLLQRAPISGN